MMYRESKEWLEISITAFETIASLCSDQLLQAAGHVQLDATLVSDYFIKSHSEEGMEAEAPTITSQSIASHDFLHTYLIYGLAVRSISWYL